MRTISARSAARLKPESAANPLPALESQLLPGPEGGAISQIVTRAFSLRRRGAIGNDGLIVRNLSARFRVPLLARPIHPWDRNRPREERDELFVQQLLEDL